MAMKRRAQKSERIRFFLDRYISADQEINIERSE